MRDLLLLFLIVALVYGFGLGRASLWDAEEGIYAEIIRQMAQSGDWVVPVYNGAPRFDQPPLMLWIGALAVRALGPTELAVRLGSFVLALLSVALVYAFGRRLHSRGAGVIAALVLPATLAWFMMGRMGVMDTGLSFFVGLSVYQLARIADAVAPAGASGRGPGLAGPYFWLGVATALSVLAKGPAALLLVGGTALFFFGPRRLGKLLWRRESVLGLGVFLLVALPWHLAAYSRFGAAWWEGYWGPTVLARFTQVPAGPGYPWYLPLIVLAIGSLPWTGFVLSGLWGAWESRGFGLGRMQGLLVAWFLVVLVCVAAARTRLPGDIGPAFLPLAVLTGIWCEERLRRHGAARALVGALWVSVAAVAATAGVLAALRPAVPEGYEELHRLLYTVPATLAGGMLLTRLVFARRTDPRALVLGFGAVALAALLGLSAAVAPRFEAYKPVKPLVTAAGPQLAQGAQLVSAFGDASAAFYAGRYTRQPVVYVAGADAVRERLRDARVLAIVPQRMPAELPGVRVVAASGPAVLVAGPTAATGTLEARSGQAQAPSSEYTEAGPDAEAGPAASSMR